MTTEIESAITSMFLDPKVDDNRLLIDLLNVVLDANPDRRKYRNIRDDLELMIGFLTEISETNKEKILRPNVQWTIQSVNEIIKTKSFATFILFTKKALSKDVCKDIPWAWVLVAIRVAFEITFAESIAFGNCKRTVDSIENPDTLYYNYLDALREDEIVYSMQYM